MRARTVEAAGWPAYTHGRARTPLQAVLVLDPVTRRPSSHAVLWMESQQRARDLVQASRQAAGRGGAASCC